MWLTLVQITCPRWRQSQTPVRAFRKTAKSLANSTLLHTSKFQLSSTEDKKVIDTFWKVCWSVKLKCRSRSSYFLQIARTNRYELREPQPHTQTLASGAQQLIQLSPRTRVDRSLNNKRVTQLSYTSNTVYKYKKRYSDIWLYKCRTLYCYCILYYRANKITHNQVRMSMACLSSPWKYTAFIVSLLEWTNLQKYKNILHIKYKTIMSSPYIGFLRVLLK